MNKLHTQNLIVNRGDFQLGPIDFELKTNAITGLVGSNGAGKTTFIQTLIGALDINSGSLNYGSLNFRNDSESIKKQYIYVPDEINFSQKLKPLVLARSIATIDPRFDISKFESLANRYSVPLKKTVYSLSAGMKKRLLFLLGISFNADILILDEPIAMIDPVLKYEFLDLLLEFMETENRSILFSSHIISDLERIADYIAIVNEGKIILYDDLINIKDTYKDENENIMPLEDIVIQLIKKGEQKHA